MRSQLRTTTCCTIIAGLLAGCASTSSYVWVDDLDAGDASGDTYIIQPGDRLAVSVWNQPTLSVEPRVRPDGHITLPLIGDIVVAGTSIPDAAAQITRLLSDDVIEPRVTVGLLEARAPTVSVIGEVREPGNFPLAAQDSLLDALAKAGGLTEFADIDRIFVIRSKPRIIRVRFDYNKVTSGEGRGASFFLHDGDVVVVR